MPLRGRQVDAAAVDVRPRLVQPVGTRADHAAVDDVAVQVAVLFSCPGHVQPIPLDLLADGDLLPLERRLDAVREAHVITVATFTRRRDDYAHRAARQDGLAAAAHDLDAGHDLRADWQGRIWR